MLQILVYIQALVLNAKPYFNEPGHAEYANTPGGEKQSLLYNEETFLLSCRTMLYSLGNPPNVLRCLLPYHIFPCKFSGYWKYLAVPADGYAHSIWLTYDTLPFEQSNVLAVMICISKCFWAVSAHIISSFALGINFSGFFFKCCEPHALHPTVHYKKLGCLKSSSDNMCNFLWFNLIAWEPDPCTIFVDQYCYHMY
jgi:hypothetical protein